LPVAVVHVAQHPAGHLELALGRAIDHVVERAERFAEEFLEALALGAEAAEYEAAVVVNVLDLRHALRGLGLLEDFRVIAALQGQRQQGAVGLEGPGVVRAAKELAGVAAGVVDHHDALVGTAVVQHAHRVVVVPHHDHGLVAHRGGEVVARIGHLAGVADIDPGVGEQVLHLELEDFFADEEIFMDLGGPHQCLYGFGVVAIAHDSLVENNGRARPGRGQGYAASFSSWASMVSSFVPLSSASAASRSSRRRWAASGRPRRSAAAAMRRWYLLSPRSWVSL